MCVMYTQQTIHQALKGSFLRHHVCCTYELSNDTYAKTVYTHCKAALRELVRVYNAVDTKNTSAAAFEGSAKRP